MLSSLQDPEERVYGAFCGSVTPELLNSDF